jgi:hypothetical protein
MRIRYSKRRGEFDVDTRNEVFHWPATRVFNVAELPLDAVLAATARPGRWQTFEPVNSFTVRLRAPMTGLSDVDLAALSSLASGAFSFRDLTGEEFTRVPGEEELTYCAATYVSMMRCGWVV